MEFYIFVLFVLVLILFGKLNNQRKDFLDRIERLESIVYGGLGQKPAQPAQPEQPAAESVVEPEPERPAPEPAAAFKEPPAVIPLTESKLKPEPPKEADGKKPATEAETKAAEQEVTGPQAPEPAPEEPGPDTQTTPPEEDLQPEPEPIPAASEPEPPAWKEKWSQFLENVDWEQFTGAKLFAWLGVVALFVASGFFVKYSIDRDLIPAKLRLMIGAGGGLALLAWAGRFKQSKYSIMRHILTAAGIGVLYSVVFAATLYYGFISKPYGFGLLALISTAAFVLAVFHKSKAVALLGAVGAYCTPILVSTGGGSLVMLFIYLAIVNAGLYLVVRRLESVGLMLFACLDTVTVLALATFFSSNPQPPLTIALVWMVNLALFGFFLDRARALPGGGDMLSYCHMAIYAPFLGIATALLVQHTGWAPLLMTTFAAAAAALAAYRDKGLFPLYIPYTALNLAVTLMWTVTRFDTGTPSAGFLLFFLYGVAGGLGPIILVVKHGVSQPAMAWLKSFPLVIVAAGLAALFVNPHASFWFWPMILLLQLAAVGLALLVRSLVQVVLSIVFLVFAVLYWITQAPRYQLGPEFFLVLPVFGILMSMVIFWASRRLAELGDSLQLNLKAVSFPNLGRWLSSLPVLGAFFLLAAVFSMPFEVFPHAGMAALTCLLVTVLFLCRRLNFGPPAFTALVASAVVLVLLVFNPANTPDFSLLLLLWSAAFFLLAVPVPFAAFKDLDLWKLTWMGWALFEVAQAIFIITCATRLWESRIAGWVPLALALVKLPAVAVLLKRLQGKIQRNAVLAFHGGTLLAYVSMAPVLLLEQGWMGLALVFEAAALLWLNRRVDHPGLRWVSFLMAPAGLFFLLRAMPQLKVAGGLKVLNPAILSLAAALLALAAALKYSRFPEPRLRGVNLPVYFTWLLTGTGFFLLNLLIADIFSGNMKGFRFIPAGDFLHTAVYALAWTGFGALLWKLPSLSRGLHKTGLLLLCCGAAWGGILPLLFPVTVSKMAPLLNTALPVYLIFCGLLLYLALGEPGDEERRLYKNTFTAFFLLLLFMGIKVESYTLFQVGKYFSLFPTRTLPQAVTSAAGWMVYGAALLLWPRNLDRIFRRAGIFLILTGLVKGVLLPFIFDRSFMSLSPLFNLPTLLYLASASGLTYLCLRPDWKDRRPLEQSRPRPFWGVILALYSFYVLNIEIIALFGTPGTAFPEAIRGEFKLGLAYSIGWLLYAVALLVTGIKWDTVKTRWAALIIMVLTAFKIFLKDLGSLGQLYRVASFVGLAAVLILVSFLYQRYLSGGGTGTGGTEEGGAKDKDEENEK